MQLAALALAALSLGTGSAAAAPWLQHGYDAGRTSATPDPGPRFDDVAFRVPAAEPTPLVPPAPLVLNGSVYVLSSYFERETWKLVRVALSDPTPAVLYEDAILRRRLNEGQIIAAAAPRWIASDGERILVGGGDTLTAHDPATGALAWRTAMPSLTANPSLQTVCEPPAIQDGTAYVACRQIGDVLYDFRLFVVAIDTATGAFAWTWIFEADETTPLDAEACPAPGLPTCSASIVFPRDVAVASPNVIVTIGRIFGTMHLAVALDAATGSRVNWFEPPYAEDPPVRPRSRGCSAGAEGSDCIATAYPMVAPAAGPTSVHLQIGHVVRTFDNGLVGESRSFPLERDNRERAFFYARTFATTPRLVYAAAFRSLHAIEGTSELPGWPVTPLAPHEYWTGPLVLAGGRTLFAASYAEDNADTLYAFDAESGATLWKRVMPKPVARDTDFLTGEEYNIRLPGISFAVGEGVLAYVHADGNLTVLGATEASLEAAAEPRSVFPAVGEEVTVDLSETGPGAFGPATGYRADWGDGSVTEWQADPILRHSFNESGPVVARFFARNDAQQTSTVLVTFHVGGSEPNFLSEAFAPENQEATFFVLGLTGTAVGGAFGLTRFTARRRRLVRELRLIDEAYERSRGSARDCEAALAERKAHCRGLLLDGKLDESQFAVVERHVEELTRSMRMSALDDRFQFLPLGMVRQMQEMLRDGRVTAWEREHFETALERERTMSAEQKERVRALVDEWFARDER